MVPKGSRVSILLVALFCFSANRVRAEAPGFGLPVEGVKEVRLSDRVGKNQVRFVSTAPLEEIHGTASGISGSIEFDPNHLEGLHGKIEVAVKSMKTGISKRDHDMYSEDWLDADRYPAIRFEIGGVKDLERVSLDPDQGKAVVKGTAVGVLTIHGVAKSIQAPFEATYLLASDRTRKRAPGDFVMVGSSFKIALRDFKVEGTRGLVGRKVGQVIHVQVNLFGSTGQEGEKE